ncbi:MAG: type 4a pilus biogenesis protein PilO [Deltaproteobacteria bacterium]|nr:type 4a pilus biogenesis protein PilO [Deltaproteobacteria bacterium]
MNRFNSLLRLFLLFTLAVFILIFFYVGLYSPREQQLLRLQTELETLENSLQKLTAQKNTLASKQLPAPTPSLPSELVNAFPKEDEIEILLSEWTRESQKLGIHFIRFKPLQEKELPPLVEMPIEIAIEGTFDQILNFFQIVTSQKRKVLISSVDLSKPRSENSVYLILANAKATTYRQQGSQP